MKTKEEALQSLEDSFHEFYSKRLNENPEEVKYITLEEFEQRWHEILDEEYEKFRKEKLKEEYEESKKESHDKEVYNG